MALGSESGQWGVRCLSGAWAGRALRARRATVAPWGRPRANSTESTGIRYLLVRGQISSGTHMHGERSGQLRLFVECRSTSGNSSDWQEKRGRPTPSRSARPARTRADAAHRLTLAICSVAILASSRAAAPPLEVPFADWDAGAGQGPSCSVTQDGRSGDHVPYFRWSGDHVAVCVEPARDPGPCLQGASTAAAFPRP
jgi:hypothetical protein